VEQINFELPRKFQDHERLVLEAVVVGEQNLSVLSNQSYYRTNVSNAVEIFFNVQPATMAEWKASGLSGLDVRSLTENEFDVLDNLSPKNTPRILAGTSNGSFYSEDGGTTWAAAENFPRAPLPQITSVVTTPQAMLAAHTGVGLYFTQGGGSYWQASQYDSLVAQERFLTIAGNSRYLFGGTDGNGIFRRPLLYTISGFFYEEAKWVKLNAGLNNLTVTALIAEEGRIFAGTRGGGVAISTNDGESWATAGSGIPSTAEVSALAIQGSAIFAATNQGLYRSTDHGLTWSPINQGLPSGLAVNAILPYGQNLFIATTAGVFLSNDKGEKRTSLPRILNRSRTF